MMEKLNRKVAGIAIKWWVVILAAAIIVGLYLRHRSANKAADANPQAKQTVPGRATGPRLVGRGGTRTIIRTIHKRGPVRVINHCPKGYHFVRGHGCVKNAHHPHRQPSPKFAHPGGIRGAG